MTFYVCFSVKLFIPYFSYVLRNEKTKVLILKIGSHFKANTFSVHNSLFYICANFIQHSSIKAKTAALFRKPAN